MKEVEMEINKLFEECNIKFESLRNQEAMLYDDIKGLNTQIIQLEGKKDSLLYNNESLGVDLKELTKINKDLEKVKTQIKEKRDGIEALKEARERLKVKFTEMALELHKSLYNEYLGKLQEIALEVQNIIDTATMKQISMWEINKEFSHLINKMNKYSNQNISYDLPTVDYMRESVENVLKIVPINHIEFIKEHGIEQYNKTYSRYGRLMATLH